MSEIEKLIEGLEFVGLSKDNPKYETDYKSIEDARNFLRALQPHDNAKYVETLKSLFKSDDWNRTTRIALNKAIAALSQPRPFDAIAHLKDGGKVINNQGLIFGKGSLRAIFMQGENGIATSIKDGEMYDFMVDLLNDRLKPYEEPQLEDGDYYVQGDCHGDPSLLANLENGLWAIMGEDGGHFAHVSNYTPITNPATNLPWRIETPEEKS